MQLVFAWILVAATAGRAQTERTRCVDVSRRPFRSLLVALRLAAGRNRVDLCVSFREKREWRDSSTNDAASSVKCLTCLRSVHCFVLLVWCRGRLLHLVSEREVELCEEKEGRERCERTFPVGLHLVSI